MALDVRALLDLGAVLVWTGAFILASLAYYIAHAVAGELDVSILGRHPFHGITTALENAIVKPLDNLRKAADARIAKGLSGLVDSLAIFVGLAVLLGLGVKAALVYLWDHAFAPRVRSIASAEIAKLKLPHVDVKAITATAVAAATVALRPAIRGAHALAQTAETDAQNAWRYADRISRSGAEAITGRIDAAVSGAAAELPRLGSLDWNDLRNLVNGKDLARLGGLLAAIPLLRGLVNTLAREAGLDSAECRAKVKQVCATDANEWGNLLAGLAAVGFAFSLAELAQVARPLVHELAPIVREAA